MEERAQITGYAGGMATAAALPQLCKLLAEKGILSGAELETIRHRALQSFDELPERLEIGEAERKALEGVRANLDELWHSAATSARD